MPVLSAWGRRRGPKNLPDAAGGAYKEDATPDSMTITQETFEFTPAVEMRQSPWHGRFLELNHEIAYQRWHSAQWIPRLQLVLTICGLLGLVAFFMGVAGGVALKASMMRAYPDRAWLLVFTRVLGSLVPVFGSAALCSKRVKDVIVAWRLYQGIPLLVFMSFILLEACPTIWLAAQHVKRPRASTKAFGRWCATGLPRRRSSLLGPSECGLPRWNDPSR
jgi:uncharacterized membrane protein YhaH (DUF805 family)